jgi:glycosyltransferase involved in cell wall biosynthesis
MTEPRLSVVVEWDNAGHEGERQALRSLRTYASQLADVDRPTEVLLLFDDRAGAGADIERLIAASGLDRVPRVTVSLHPAPGLRYYQLKNEGAKLARGEIVVFCDSDVTPEPGWLGSLLAMFDRPEVSVVSSAVYVGPTRSLYEKSFALFWSFLWRRDGERAPYKTHHFSANSVAFRREVFLRYRFPEDDRLRGQCHTLAQTLGRDGVDIWMMPTARVMHPPPKGFGYMVRRALWHGHDRYVSERIRGRRPVFVDSLRMYGAYMESALQGIRSGRRAVGLSAWGVPPAIGLAVIYVGFSWLGFTLTRWDRGLLARRAPL